MLYQLNFTNQGHITEIAQDATLTVGGTTDPYVFAVGAYVVATEPTTLTQFQGPGTLSIQHDNGIVFLGSNTTAGGKATTSTNMDGLSNFIVDVGESGSFQIGTNTAFDTAIPQYNKSTVTFGESNNIRSGLLAVSSVVGDVRRHVGAEFNDSQSTLYLGLDNTFHVDQLHVGRGYFSLTNGLITLKESLDLNEVTPTLFLRGTDGVSAVNELLIAVDGGPNSGGQILMGSVDLSGIEVDAIIENITIASAKTSGTAGRAEGDLIMDRGTIAATDVTLGQTIQGLAVSSGSATNVGALTVAGGTFTAENIIMAVSESTLATNVAPISGILNIDGDLTSVRIENGITMGHHTGIDNNAPLSATINLDGGMLEVEGDIAKGQEGAGGITSTINLRGGTLELNGNNIDVGSFIAESGIVRNLGELNSGGNLIKTTGGTLTLEGTLAYSGQTEVQEGLLLINGTLTNSDILVGALGTIAGNGVIGGSLHFESGAGIVFSLNETLTVNGTEVTFSDFSVSDIVGLDATVDTGIYTLINGSADIITANLSNLGSDNPFDLGDGKLAYFQTGSLQLVVIPEPAIWSVFGGVFAVFLVILRRMMRRSPPK